MHLSDDGVEVVLRDDLVLGGQRLLRHRRLQLQQLPHCHRIIYRRTVPMPSWL